MASMSSQDLELTARKASPGGSMKAFWEPETTMSIPQSSVLKSIPPMELTVSTTNSGSPGEVCTASPIAARSLTTPVDVSQ